MPKITRTTNCFYCEEEFTCTTHHSITQRYCSVRCGKMGSGSGRKALSLDEVLKRFRETHGDFYNYSQVDYINARTMVSIICQIHGMFKQKSFDHMAGRGCQQCGIETTKETCLRIYGVENVSQNSKIIKKKRKTKIKNGVITDPIYKDKWSRYCELVISETEKSYTKYYDIINPQNLPRGHDYHLDHIYSKTDGFRNNVAANILGHWTNLRIITKKENLIKSKHSGKTLKNLYEDFNLAIT